MRTLIAALMTLAFFAATPAAAHNSCTPTQEQLEDIANAAVAIGSAVKEVRVLNAAETARVVAWYNEQPPVSDDHYDLAIVVLIENGTVGLLLGDLDHAEICFAGRVPDDLVPAMWAVIAGKA